MTPSMIELLAATTIFVASHIVLASHPLRPKLVGVLGENVYRGAYSLLSIALIVWVVMAYNDAPWVQLWPATTGLRHLSLGVMPFAFIFVVAGVATPSPAAIGPAEGGDAAARGPVGINKVTRHPVMWGIALWGIVHLLARGDLAGLMLFGGMTVLALAGAAAQDVKKATQLGAAWDSYRAQTSYVPFAALIAGRTRVSIGEIGWWRIALGLAAYGVFLWLHGWIFGVDPWPL